MNSFSRLFNHHSLWVLLLLITLLSYMQAEDSVQSGVTGLILTLTAVKGALIIDGFMELHGVRHWVRYLMHLYCPVLAMLVWAILQI